VVVIIRFLLCFHELTGCGVQREEQLLAERVVGVSQRTPGRVHAYAAEDVEESQVMVFKDEQD
jgi:hypothetical protein